MEKIRKKMMASAQFAEVADFIAQIANTQTGEIVVNDFKWLCRDPWSNKLLPSNIANLSTTHFIAQFPSMKSTSCERHLRKYKELHREYLNSINGQ